jgi:hypothetical protein
LIEASRDYRSIFGRDGEQERHHHRSRESCQYFSKRYYNFLRSMPELKSTVSDEEALQRMQFIS